MLASRFTFVREGSALSGRTARAARLLVAVGCLVLAGAAAPSNDEFKKGWHAYQRGAFDEARTIWLPLAETGDPRAQYNMGLLYAEGRGVTIDKTKAAAWWTRAAGQGHLRAMHNLALLNIAGIPKDSGGTVVQNYADALKWLRAAAGKGFPNSQYTLGKMYQYGLGVKQNDKRAALLFKRSAEQGFARAQYNLAKAYRDGAGVPVNKAQSFALFRKAAEAGYAKAQYKLSTRFAQGRDVERDDVEALKWCLLAARQGHTDARKRLDDLIMRMSLEDVGAAAVRAHDFTLAHADAAAGG